MAAAAVKCGREGVGCFSGYEWREQKDNADRFFLPFRCFWIVLPL
jgi:hypothetical protein